MTIDLEIDERIKRQCTEAGFATVEEYLYSLLIQDGERLSIERGLADVKEGRLRTFAEFDSEFCKSIDISTDC